MSKNSEFFVALSMAAGRSSLVTPSAVLVAAKRSRYPFTAFRFWWRRSMVLAAMASIPELWSPS